MNRGTIVALTATAVLAGCTLSKQELRRELFPGAVGTEGRLLLPKRCDLTIRTVRAPLGDPSVDEAVWQAADEVAIADEETRSVLEANGLRLGVITGPLPAELESRINAPPPNRVDTVEVVRGEGEGILVRLTPESEAPTETSLLQHRQGRAVGKVYQDLRGLFRISASHDGPDGVALRLVPELHHGAVQRRFNADPNADPFAPQQFLMKDGQQEDTLRDLAANVSLRPDQVLVLGCRSDRPSSLGYVLMCDPEKGSDRMIQKLVLITGRRNMDSQVAKSRSRTTPTVLQPFDPDEESQRKR